ncbi:MAG: hypothetical protein AAFO70_05210 [Pseudomonadota bacterium]
MSAKPRLNETPVDLVHLSRQTMGDRSLERDVLQIFRSQSAYHVERLRAARSLDERRMASHTLLGAARGIGAWEVADAAEPCQKDDPAQCDLDAVSEAVRRTNAFIVDMLG